MFNSEIRETLDRQHKYAEKLRQRIEKLEAVAETELAECDRRIEELEARLAAREEYISRRERQYDETVNSVISLVFDKGKLEAENNLLRKEGEYLLALLEPLIWQDEERNSCGLKAGDSSGVYAIRLFREALEGGEDE